MGTTVQAKSSTGSLLSVSRRRGRRRSGTTASVPSCGDGANAIAPSRRRGRRRYG
ncbi:MAG: hypothetical protein NZ843_04440 [Fimbriimonadales bacterium]|nr:hypothetical protein [Fimbriimonadales bacterium]